jgi:hypothetical protein
VTPAKHLPPSQGYSAVAHRHCLITLGNLQQDARVAPHLASSWQVVPAPARA